MYASIRQAKAKTGMAEELARRIKEGAIPIISDVEGFRAYYVVPTSNPTLVTIACESADYRCDEGLVQLDLVRSGRPVPVAGGAANRNPGPATSAQCVAA